MKPGRRDGCCGSFFGYLAATRFHPIVALLEPTRESEDPHTHGRRENSTPSGVQYFQLK